MHRNQANSSIHFIGIGGSGMRPLAEISLKLGYNVSGSDISASNNTQKLKSLGAKIHLGHSSESVEEANCVIYSSAVNQDNVELLAAEANPEIQVFHRSQFLAKLCENHQIIAVAGTHGKTTTAALIAHILEYAGLNPKAAIGGKLLNYDTYSLCGSGELFVIEADESDGSFLNYKPFISVVNNIDEDHLDHYRNLENIFSAFRSFVSNTSSDGFLVCNWDHPNCFEIGSSLPMDRMSFGRRLGSDVRLLSRKIENGKQILSIILERESVELVSELIGAHNCENILSAVSVAQCLELPKQLIKEAVASFKGVDRRLSLLTLKNTDYIKLYNDYAHNPTKIASCIHACSEAYPEYKLSVIFQPHRYSRVKTMYNDFCRAFVCADEVFVTQVFSAGESMPENYNHTKFIEDIARYSNINAQSYHDHEQLLQDLKEKRLYLFLGAGDIDQLSYCFKDKLDESFEKT